MLTFVLAEMERLFEHGKHVVEYKVQLIRSRVSDSESKECMQRGQANPTSLAWSTLSILPALDRLCDAAPEEMLVFICARLFFRECALRGHT